MSTRRSSRRATLCLCLLAACSGLAAQTSPPLRFAWPVPCSVEVREKTLKRGKQVEMTYTAVLERGPAGKGLTLSLRDLRFVSVDGQDASRPELQAALAPAMAIAAAIPRLMLTEQGEIAGLGDLDESLDRALALVKRARAADDKLLANLRAQLRTPQGAAMMQEAATQFWGVWVGGWRLEEPPARGTTEEFVHQRLGADGRRVEVPFTVTHHGTPEQHPEHIRLATEEVIRGELAKELLMAPMRTLLAGALPAADKREEFERVVAEMEWNMTVRCEVITDPRTLQPIHARAEKLVAFTVPKQGEKKDREVREYWFTWK